jgi:hypothetical protein
LESATAKLGADFKIVAPKVGGAVAADGQLIEADFQLAGGPSVLFDAVFVALPRTQLSFSQLRLPLLPGCTMLSPILR